jgi:hypothetical protein
MAGGLRMVPGSSSLRSRCALTHDVSFLTATAMHFRHAEMVLPMGGGYY